MLGFHTSNWGIWQIFDRSFKQQSNASCQVHRQNNPDHGKSRLKADRVFYCMFGFCQSNRLWLVHYAFLTCFTLCYRVFTQMQVLHLVTQFRSVIFANVWEPTGEALPSGPVGPVSISSWQHSGTQTLSVYATTNIKLEIGEWRFCLINDSYHIDLIFQLYL